MTLAETEIGRETEVAVTGAERGLETETAAATRTPTAGSHAEKGTAVEMTTGAVDATVIAVKSGVNIDLVWPGIASPLALCFLASSGSCTEPPSRFPQIFSTCSIHHITVRSSAAPLWLLLSLLRLAFMPRSYNTY